jgi:hypothetical protein
MTKAPERLDFFQKTREVNLIHDWELPLFQLHKFAH